MTASLNILAIGASQNIGYHTALHLLAEGHTVTFLLRRKNTFDHDERVQEYIKSGHAKLSFGDALSKDDIQKAWDVAAEKGSVDYVIFTVGGKPEFSWTKGIHLGNPRICSSCMHALLSVMSNPQTKGVESTKVIAVTSNGVTKKSHDAMPFLVRIFCNLVLTVPHQDKRAVEKFMAHCTSNPDYELTDKEILYLEKSGHLFSNWGEGLRKGDLLETLVVRPSLLTDGVSVCETKGPEGMRAGPEDLPSAWTISRKDVGWFIAKKAIKDWDSYKGKAVTVTY